jgi:hypothetical protein
MQFSVPQFTEVEDKIIGGLTIKQFGILFGAGVVIFLGFTVTKSVIVLVFIGILVGLPALGLAFAKLNGRPIYNMFGYLMKYLTSPKILVFHKEGSLVSPESKSSPKDDIALKETVSAQDPQARLKEISGILEKKREEEKELFK